MIMKKATFFMLLIIASVNAFAQLQVNANGMASIGSSLIGSTLKAGLQSGLTTTNAGFNIGLFGCADNTSNIGAAYGVYGKAINASDGLNIGVAGVVEQNMNGVGILGSSFPVTGAGTPSAVYAGYFLGNVKVLGTLTATSLVQTSDSRLKENIHKLNDQTSEILDKVLDINVVEYNYKPMIPSLVLDDSVSVEEVIKKAGLNIRKKHYGVIAQELQELFPTLVDEDQNGYLGVNYVELVPVLIRAIQELNAELEAIKGNDTERRAPSVTGISTAKATDNVLYQNTPNPFNEQTTIRFSLADDARDASICIFDMTGKMLKNLPVSSSMESVSINGYELGEGMFLYSLIVNGQVIDTKRMVISK